MQTSFSQLRKNLKKDFSGLKPVRVALLGDSATQFLAQALRGAGFDARLDLQVWEADFNQIERQVFDPGAELYQHQPQIIILFYSTHKLLGQYNKLDPAHQANFGQNHLSKLQEIYQTISSQLNSQVILFNYAESTDSVFGHFSNKVASSFPFQIRQLNTRLMEWASQEPGLFIFDLALIQAQIGKVQLFHPAVYVNTEMVISPDALPNVAIQLVQLIGAMNGQSKKCVILDLDNTTWGGIIGDDGLENIQIGALGIGKAFTEFQYWVKKLKNRGIIVAVCSKNTDSVAREPFEKHPDMVLRLEDIAVFVANWENKADNIRHIQQVLNIGFDSMVFLDDNPFERNLVRENLPDVTVPELPEDPAEYLEYLYSLNLFETISYSEEDAERTKQYQVEAQRANMQQRFTNEQEFLESLQMVSVVEPINNFNTPRVAQLSQRSNQFNLRTVRYTEADIARIGTDPDFASFTFTLSDKFGDNGLICVVLLKKESEKTLFIDTWFMSCRVLKRTMENFVINTLVNYAKEQGFEELIGEYIPTAKNAMVQEHYPGLSFIEDGTNRWKLRVAEYNYRTCFITPK